MVLQLSVIGFSRPHVGRPSRIYSPAFFSSSSFHGLSASSPSLRLSRTRMSFHKLSVDASIETSADDDDPVSKLSHIPLYWQGRLRELIRPAAVTLIPALSTENSLCFVNKAQRTDSLANYAAIQKDMHPEKVLLIRVGEFYEAFGIDALMLIEYAGLNPMGRKCRAGCPIQNLQSTLNDLTAAGLTIAVYEEVEKPHTSKGKLKNRELAQVVSPGSPTYMYEACLSHDEIAYTEPPPYVGVCSTATGYSVVQVYVDSRAYRVQRRLSVAALRALLSAMPHAPPLLLSRDTPRLPFLPSDRRTLPLVTPQSFDATSLMASKNRFILTELSSTASHANQSVVEYVAEQSELAPTGFRQLHSNDANGSPRHIYLPTASQIGLLPTPGVPDLPAALLPTSARLASMQLLRRWLLLPPPPHVADAIHKACRQLMFLESSLPTAIAVPVGKVVGLLSARQGNAPLFVEIRQMLSAMQQAMARVDLEPLNDALFQLVEFESGIRLAAESLPPRFAHIMGTIDAVVTAATLVANADPPSSSADDQVASFFERNEMCFRGLVVRERVGTEYEEVALAAVALEMAVEADLPDNYELNHDVINNALHFKPTKRRVDIKTPTTSDGYEEVKDRNRRLISGRITSSNVRQALAAYLDACDNAHTAVRFELQSLCDELQGELPAIVFAAHWTLLSSTLSAHVGCALAKGWMLPNVREIDDPQRALEIEGLWPYWLSGNAATKNSFIWEGIWLLTAPNMAGKSTLMRSTTVAALLANVGLLAPIKQALVPRYDCYFVRTASFDVPSEGKSSFAQEMDDLHVLTTECGSRSLVMLDEIGRGTSTREGTALGVALLEWLHAKDMSAIFATHLHEIDDTLNSMTPMASLHRRCMRVTSDSQGEVHMHYELEEGVCTDSLALHAARMAGLPAPLLDRMQALVEVAKDLRPSGSASVSRSPNPAHSGEAIRAGGASNESMSSGEDVADQRLTVVGKLLQEASGADSFIHVPYDHDPPPKLSGCSCVYVLQLRRSRAPVKEVTLGTPMYVGESDRIAQRLRQHRTRRRTTRVECVLVQVESKSRALEVEALMIGQLKALRMGRVTNIVHS